MILSGGSGTRLWPMSRKSLPKQFIPLVSERTMLQETVARLAGLPESEPPILVCNDEHRFIAAGQLHDLGVRPALQILEPVGRNTAPAAAVAALEVRRTDPEGILAVLPSDHAIADAARLREALHTAAQIARQSLLVTFGVTPTRPDIGYGYIETGESLPGSKDAFRIRRFVEKPDAETARGYVASERFLWNSGMFVFKATRFLEELERLRPDILAAAKKSLAAAVKDLDFLRLDRIAFEACPSQSIDYAVMEKTSAGAVLRAPFGWSDVGSWSALWDHEAKDAAGNVARGDVHLQDAKRCYVWGDSRLVFALGVADLIVVETDDAVLVADRAHAQDVKSVVDRLHRDSRSEHVTHRRVYRPWGYFEAVDAGDRYQVKRIMVNPGQALSLQLHHKRAEHWVVVSGRARITRGEESYDMVENQSTFIPVGVKHRLENPAQEPLYVIEVQSGAYLGEDDIVRLEDRYRRS